MRLPYRGVLLTIISVVAMSVVTAASASAALPEFKPMPAKKKFTSTNGASIWDVGAASTISCSKSTISGEITGATTLGDVVAKYTACSIKNSDSETCPVKSASGGKEEILMNTLKGELGTIVPKPTSGSNVGLLLQPEVKTTWATLEGSCVNSAVLRGSLAGVVNVPDGKTGTIAYGVTGGVQNIKEMTMDSGSIVKPHWETLEPVTLEATDTLKFEEALEVT
jgi:hypothetical protein